MTTELLILDNETTQTLEVNVVENLVSAEQGPQGPQGIQGPIGPAGPQGPSGNAVVYIAASAISGHVVVTLDAAGEVIAADPTIAAHGNTVIGVTVGAASGGSPVELATSGVVSHAGWSFTIDQPVFAGTGGQVTQTPPVAVWQKVIGVARSATSFALSLQPAIF